MQFATRKKCYDVVKKHEALRGFKYDVYARIRLDTVLFMAVPWSFVEMALLGEDVVVIPAGEDYGKVDSNGISAGVNDRMMVGQERAFTVDAHFCEMLSKDAASAGRFTAHLESTASGWILVRVHLPCPHCRALCSPDTRVSGDPHKVHMARCGIYHPTGASRLLYREFPWYVSVQG